MEIMQEEEEAHCVEQLQFPGKDNPMRELCVAAKVFHELESLEVEGEDSGEMLHPQPFGSFLLAATHLTVVLILCRQCL